MSGADPGEAGGAVRTARLLPWWVARATSYGLAVLVAAAVCWLLAGVLLRLALVSFTVAIAVLLTALLWPLVGRLRRSGVYPWVAALVALVLLLGFLGGVGILLWTRVEGVVQELVPALTAGIDDIQNWLTTGPLSLDPTQVSSARDQIVQGIYAAVPSPVAGARAALDVAAAFALALFAVFFFLKDGPGMWGWLLERVPRRHRERTDGAGRRAWATLTAYAVGATAVALVDAVLIGGGLLLLGVPLWISLTLLTFIAAYVPVLGATVSGAVAVLVTLVTQGGTAAVIALAVVLLVQQVEGNLLQPLLMGHAVHLHPVVTLVAVTCGFLLLGIPGAILAVPVVAVAYQVAEFLRTHRSAPSQPSQPSQSPSPRSPS